MNKRNKGSAIQRTTQRRSRRQQQVREFYINLYRKGMRDDMIFDAIEDEFGYSRVTAIQYLGSRKKLQEEVKNVS